MLYLCGVIKKRDYVTMYRNFFLSNASMPDFGETIYLTSPKKQVLAVGLKALLWQWNVISTYLRFLVFYGHASNALFVYFLLVSRVSILALAFSSKRYLCRVSLAELLMNNISWKLFTDSKKKKLKIKLDKLLIEKIILGLVICRDSHLLRPEWC